MTLNTKKVVTSIIVITIVNVIALGCIYYFSNKNISSEPEIPYLVSEEIYTLKTEYSSLLKEVKSLQEQYKVNSDNKIQVQISYKYNELTTIAEKINAHMKLNSGENNFSIKLPTLEYMNNNTIENLITYSFE
jgi:hypothetical protein